MRVKDKTVHYTLSFYDKELKVILECLKNGATDCYDPRDASLAIDLIRDFEEIFPEEIEDESLDDGVIKGIYADQIREEMMRPPSASALERNSKSK